MHIYKLWSLALLTRQTEHLLKLWHTTCHKSLQAELKLMAHDIVFMRLIGYKYASNYIFSYQQLSS